MAKAPHRSIWDRFIILKLIKKATSWLWANVKWAIVIGLFGGIPGIITIWNNTFSHSKFAFYALIVTEGKHDSTEYWVLSGAIFNKGKQPLFPVMFTLTTTYKNTDQVFTLYSKVLPPDSVLNKDLATRDSFDREKDLLKVLRVDPNDAVYGCIYLETYVTNIEKYPPKSEIETMKVICTDIKGTKTEYEIPYKNSEVLNGKLEEPKTGTKVH